ncbi:MAG TPA: YtxH domain-containing protein [Paludibacter sp.]|jgi:gas vesicle protein|nr:YtxH domain-containing protein [Paludibacter sp.]HZK69167.1 YtxH domain-containing protein [Paludibacter sp.]
MKNPVGLLAAFLGGAVIGGALGLLFAPESGEETRKKIAEALEKRGIKLSKSEMEDLVDEIKSEMSPEAK